MTCLGCQQENRAGAKFCQECGARLAVGGPPRSYTPRHLAEKILTSRQALEGERKQVTVLFADMKGSLELLADRDPEEARALLDPVIERMMAAVHRYEGTVNQVMGDGIMALFGAPIAHEDHAVRACYAALGMQEAVRRYAADVEGREGLAIRVGLNSGEVVVRSIGSDLDMDYTAVGRTTHVAARMEQLAPPGSIWMTSSTLRLARGLVHAKPVGEILVKGLAAPVEVFELVDAGAARPRLEASAVRGLTRFVGRERELDVLRRALANSRAGHGQIVAVAGEPGVGKSRLFWELTSSAEARGWLVLESGTVSYGKNTAYLPVVELLKAYFRIETGDEHAGVREKVATGLLKLDAGLRLLLPPLLSLLDVPVDDAEWHALDPPQRRQRTLDAIKRLLLGESQSRPVLLVLEDLQWMDSESQAALNSVVESLPAARMLVLVNYRPDYRHAWSGKSCYAQVTLDALPAGEAEAFLRASLGDDPALEPLRRLLIARTEGNPFFLEETVRALIEAGVLAGERGAWRLAKPVESIRVPATVQAVLAARIDRLEPEDKRLLQSASVVGKDVPLALLRAIADLDDEDLRRRLGGLQTAEFLYETRRLPEIEYTFTHALTHEVVYESLLRERRRALHAQVVEAIEQLWPERFEEQIDRLALHALEGQAWDKAATYCRRAGAKAASRSAHREAVACFERARQALRRLPEGAATSERLFDLLVDLRMSLLPLGELGRIQECLHEAEALAVRLDDQRRLGQLFAYMTNHFYMTGDQERALDLGQRALAIAARRQDFALEVETHYRLGQIHYTLGDYGRAIEVLHRCVESLRGDLVYERFKLPGLPSVIARTWLVRCLAERGEFTGGIARGDEAIRIAETADHPFSLAFAYWGVGHLELRRGDLDRAIPVLERGLEVCRRWNITVWFSRFTSALGHAYAVAGRIGDALPLLEGAVAEATSMGLQVYRALFALALGEGYLRGGRLDDAAEVARRALELSRQHGQRGDEAWSLWLAGELAARREPPEGDAGEGSYRAAIALSEELGMAPLEAHCHRGLAQLDRTRGDQAGARSGLALAAALYRSMDMQRWLAPTEAELAALA